MSRLRALLLPLVCLFALAGATAPHFAPAFDRGDEISVADSGDETPDSCEEADTDFLAADHSFARPTLVELGDYAPSESALFVHYPPPFERPPRLARFRA